MLPQTLAVDLEMDEKKGFLTSQLITYIGNKRRLGSFITKAILEAKRALGKEKIKFLDLFSGTGVVSRIAKQSASLLVANDLERYSKITNDCYLSNQSDVVWADLRTEINRLGNLFKESSKLGFISELYAPQDEHNISVDDRVFYTRRNALYLDTIVPEVLKLDDTIRDYLLAPLLYQASVSTNTSGVFKGFHKNKQGIGQYGGSGKDALKRICREVNVMLPVLSRYACEVEVHQCDANDLVKNIDEHFDIAYLDPPYNQHPYGSNYFMLNLLCNYQKPSKISRVSGIPNNWNRSAYNKKRTADTVLLDAIERCPAHFVLVSYNSEGFVKHDTFVKHMMELGRVKVMDTKYNTFRGCRNLKDRDIHTTEFLFLLDRR